MIDAAGGDTPRRGRASIILAAFVVVLAVVVVVLWRALEGSTFGVDLDEQLERFPAPEQLSAVGDARTGSGAPFLGERPGRVRVFASEVDAEPTCALLDVALEAYAPDAEPVRSGRPTGEPSRSEPAASCDVAGPRQVGGAPGSAVHVRASVHTPEHYDRLAEVGAVPVDVDTERAAAVVVLRLQR